MATMEAASSGRISRSSSLSHEATHQNGEEDERGDEEGNGMDEERLSSPRGAREVEDFSCILSDEEDDKERERKLAAVAGSNVKLIRGGEGLRFNNLGNLGNSMPSLPSARKEEPPIKDAGHIADATQEEIAEHNRQRQLAANEIVETEKDYVKDLELLVKLYLQPLRRLLSDDFVTAIFSNLVTLLSVHKILSESLEMANDKDGHFAQVFLNNADYLKLYTTYTINHAEALQTIRQLKQRNATFAAFLVEVQKKPETKNQSLNGFLIKPVQRICKYPLLIQKLLKHTFKEHADHDGLAKALDKLQAVAAHVNKHHMRSQNINKMIEIQQCLLSLGKRTLIDPTREFRHELDLMMAKQDKMRKTPRHVFLFNDLLIVAKRKDTKSRDTPQTTGVHAPNGSKPLFIVKNWLPLPEVLTRNLEDNTQCGHVNSFEIWHTNTNSKKNKLWVVSCNTPEEKEKLFKLINKFKLKLKRLSQKKLLTTLEQKSKKLSRSRSFRANTNAAIVHNIQRKDTSPLIRPTELMDDSGPPVLTRDVSPSKAKVQASDSEDEDNLSSPTPSTGTTNTTSTTGTTSVPASPPQNRAPWKLQLPLTNDLIGSRSAPSSPRSSGPTEVKKPGSPGRKESPTTPGRRKKERTGSKMGAGTWGSLLRKNKDKDEDKDKKEKDKEKKDKKEKDKKKQPASGGGGSDKPFPGIAFHQVVDSNAMSTGKENGGGSAASTSPWKRDESKGTHVGFSGKSTFVSSTPSNLGEDASNGGGNGNSKPEKEQDKALRRRSVNYTRLRNTWERKSGDWEGVNFLLAKKEEKLAKKKQKQKENNT